MSVSFYFNENEIVNFRENIHLKKEKLHEYTYMMTNYCLNSEIVFILVYIYGCVFEFIIIIHIVYMKLFTCHNSCRNEYLYKNGFMGYMTV